MVQVSRTPKLQCIHQENDLIYVSKHPVCRFPWAKDHIVVGGGVCESQHIEE